MGRPIVLLALLLAALRSGAMTAKAPAGRAAAGALGQWSSAVRTRSAPRRVSQWCSAINVRIRPIRPAATRCVSASLLNSKAWESDPVVRDQLACNELHKARGVSCARVRNVIAVIGPSTGKAVLLNAHYDSVALGPGASDDGMGVATLLEVAWVMKDRPLKRPLILLFNEGEELGLVGARAFLADPLEPQRRQPSLTWRRAGCAARPICSRPTPRQNGAPVTLFARAVAHPVANSLSTDVYRLMPNYTDVNSFDERGWLTLNIAPIGNETRYHSPGDELAALDHRTLQHMGEARRWRWRKDWLPVPPRGHPATKSSWTCPDEYVDFPATAGGSGVACRPADRVRLGDVAARRSGAGRRCLRRNVTAVERPIAWVFATVIGLIRPGMFWRAYSVWTDLAVYASVIAAAVLLLATLGRSAHLRQLRASFWLMFLLVGAAIGLLATGRHHLSSCSRR